MKELLPFKEYLLSELSENAKDHLAFPLFQKLFGSKFKKQSEAEGADIYIEGKLLVELKSKTDDYIAGFFQALHYAKKGLTYSSICVVSYKFVGLWKVNNIPDFAKKLSYEADPLKSPSDIGVALAKKVKSAQKIEILKSAFFTIAPIDFESFFGKEADIDTPLYEFKNVLKNLEYERLQVNPRNFIHTIELMKSFFNDPLEAIHFFYAIVGYWTTSSTVTKIGESNNINIIDNTRGNERSSEPIKIIPRNYNDIKSFIEKRFIFTNEGSGLTVDYYFSRFDEVISKVKPEYAKQHGIFFTDHNLSKFALWFVREFYEKKLSDKYIVLDPAGGSGNLVMSWKGHLKHKIVCELEPDLLKMIDRRMKLDPEHVQAGFTVVPKSSRNEGLNFLDKPAEEYIRILAEELREKNLYLDKPFAFLLNPPYKNTDENENVRIDVNAQYEIDSSIIKLTGSDAGKERYLAFLAQIVNISRLQMGDSNPVEGSLDFSQTAHLIDKSKVKDKPLLLIFTPSSWLIPRPTYVSFRKIFDKYFKYEAGFIVTGSEFFKIGGRFPISFTIWKYNYNEKGNKNKVIVRDLTNMKNSELQINWNRTNDYANNLLKPIWKNAKDILFSQSRLLMKKWCSQKMYDFKRDPTKSELLSNEIYGGLPLRDDKRNNKKTYGISNSEYIGFLDKCNPVRVKEDKDQRVSINSKRCVWFLLPNVFQHVNYSRVHNGPTDKYSYCAYDLDSSKQLFTWYSITKSVNGVYPVWANQYDLWAPGFSKLNLSEKQKDEFLKYFYSLCFSFVLAENRCVVTKFEKDNPVLGAPEVFVDNPLCPTNPESFWSTTLDREIPRLLYSIKNGNRNKLVNPAFSLVSIIKEFYTLWNKKYCKGQNIYNVGLHDEPYFKYFEYADFLTPYSGIIQIKKFTEIHNHPDLSDLLKKISIQSKIVKDEIYKILINDLKYFE